MAVVFALELIMGGLGHQRLSAQQEPVTRTILLRTDAAGVEGKPAITFKPGDAFQQPPQQVHEGQNASAMAPVKILAFYLANKGQP